VFRLYDDQTPEEAAQDRVLYEAWRARQGQRRARISHEAAGAAQAVSAYSDDDDGTHSDFYDDEGELMRAVPPGYARQLQLLNADSRGQGAELAVSISRLHEIEDRLDVMDVDSGFQPLGGDEEIHEEGLHEEGGFAAG
jgi:hypothetical protein